MISPSAEFHSKPPKGRKVETKRCWMFQILSQGTTKGEVGSQVSEHSIRVLCTSEILLVGLGLTLKHWSLLLVVEISRSHPE